MLSSNPDCNPECRACHYKDLAYPAQLARKQRWAREQLGRWGEALREIIPAPEAERLGYRHKSWMQASREGDGHSFGMFRAVRVNGEWEKEFVSWNTCPLHAESIRKMVDRLRREALPESIVGIWFGSPHVVIVSREPVAEACRQLPWSEILTAPFDRAWFHHNAQVGAKVFGHHPLVQLAGPALDQSHPVKAFRQAAHTLLKQAREFAVGALLEKEPSMVLDLYCGTGDLSLLLPMETGWLGIEQSRDAVNFANTLRPGSSFVGAVEQRLVDPSVIERITSSYALFLNPPRSGLSEEARARLLALFAAKGAPTSIVYLSCSASGMARDLPAFESAGFRVDLLQPFDFFPQTEHFETLARLSSCS